MVVGLRGIPDVQGGVETHAQHLYPRLAAMGCDVEVLVRTSYVPKGLRRFGAITLRRIWAPTTVGLEALVHSVLGVLYAGIQRPDILHIHAVGPAIATPLARWLRLKVVVTHHGPDYERDKWGSVARRVLRIGEDLGMRYASSRIAISQVIKDLIKSKYRVDAELIPNGVVAVKASVGTDFIRSLGLEPRRYIVQVSRFVPEKRQLDLINAYQAISPCAWKLVLVGSLGADAYSMEVKAAADRAGVVLTGFLKGAALQETYSHAGVFVLPSSHEGLPIALLEALSYGLPVLASDIPANREVGLEASSHFPVGDVRALAANLLRVIQGPVNAEEMAARRRWVASRFDWDRIAEQTFRVYRAVSEKSSQS